MSIAIPGPSPKGWKAGSAPCPHIPLRLCLFSWGNATLGLKDELLKTLTPKSG